MRSTAYPPTARPCTASPVRAWSASASSSTRRWAGRAAALIVLALVAVPLARPDDAAPAHPGLVGFTPPEGPRRTGPLDLAFVVDRSGSINRADPRGVMAGELRLFLDWLHRWGRPEDRYAVVVHVADAHVAVPLRTAAGAVPSPASLLSGAPPADITAFSDATKTAMQVLSAASPSTSGDKVVVFITDGAGDDVAQAASALPDDVGRYVIGLNGGGLWAQSRDRWEQAVGPERTWTIGRISPGELAEPLAELLSGLTGQQVQTQEVPGALR